MKAEIVGELTQEKEIDWSKPMIVESDSCIVITNGNNTEKLFQGVIIYDKVKIYKEVSIEWVKSSFKVRTIPITIKFEND